MGRPERVYVTGGSGFLGRQIVRLARAAGYDVLAPRSSECDLSDLASVTGWLAQQKEAGQPVDAIIHSAAYYGGLQITMAEPADIFFKNTQMINNLFQAAAQAGVTKVVGVGSACGYPGAILGDMKESDFWSGPLHDSVIGYGFTKKIMLAAQIAYHQQYGIEGSHLILTNLYGPHDVFQEYRGHAISVLIKRYIDAADEGKESVTNWGNGSAVREFMHVEDAAQVVVSFLEQPHDLAPYNVGTGVGTSIRELTTLIASFADYQGAVEWDTSKPNGAPRKVLDLSRLREVLPEFAPRSLEEGLRSTISWYRDNKEEANQRQ